VQQHISREDVISGDGLWRRDDRKKTAGTFRRQEVCSQLPAEAEDLIGCNAVHSPSSHWILLSAQVPVIGSRCSNLPSATATSATTTNAAITSKALPSRVEDAGGKQLIKQRDFPYLQFHAIAAAGRRKGLRLKPK
jgi:hypothetical protein